MIKRGTFLLILLYLTGLVCQYLRFDFDQSFGYLDPQLYWQGLSDLSTGKIIYRDFYWEYGFLYLVIGLPFFLLLGKTFLASVFVRLLILPIIAIFLSFLIGKELLKRGGALILFLLLLFLYGVNNDFTSLRHLLPELGLIILVVSLERNNRRKTLLGSFLIGLSLISSVEYGGAAIIGVGSYFLIAFLRKPASLVFSQILKFLTVTGLVAIPYFCFLWKTGALKNFITFTLQYAQSFYYNSPCRELFPRLNELAPNWINLYPRLNLYFVPLFLITLLGWAMTKRKAKWFPIVAPLLIYSLLIFYRTLNTPCLEYMNYGLTFLFLILVFALSLPTKSFQLKTGVLLIIFWFLLSAIPRNISKFFIEPRLIKSQKMAKMEFLPMAGVKLKKELTNEYQKIVDFIKKNSQDNDYLYVYPNGPYNQLTERKSPVSVASTWYYDLVPSLVDVTFQQLNQKKPKLVIINIYNARSIKSALNNITYNIHSEGKEIIFEGLVTPVEDFISQNYEISKKFELAWVLTKRDEPKLAKKLYLPADKTAEWKISTQGLSQNQYLSLDNSLGFRVNEKNPLIEIQSKALGQTDLVKIPIRVNLGMEKMFSKFIISVYGQTNDGKSYLLNRQLATSDWQDIWAYLSKNSLKTTSIIMLLSDNKGFFWWGKPKNIELKQIEALILNKNLKLDDRAFK